MESTAARTKTRLTIAAVTTAAPATTSETIAETPDETTIVTATTVGEGMRTAIAVNPATVPIVATATPAVPISPLIVLAIVPLNASTGPTPANDPAISVTRDEVHPHGAAGIMVRT